MPGISYQPELVLTARTSTGAPQAGQARLVPALTMPHQGQV
jgi:hypothetical protein